MSASKYGVTRSEVDEFCGDPCVAEWLGKFRESTKETNVYALSRYFKWLRVVKNLDVTPKTLLDLRDAAKTREEKRQHLRWVLQHTRDNPDFRGHSDERKYDIFIIIKGFYEYFEVPLTTAKNVFGPRKRRNNNRKQITLAQAKQIISAYPQREKTILLIVLQSGQEIGAVLDKMNFMWDKIIPQIENGNMRVKVDFPERKGNSFPYFTYFGHDAVQEFKKWLMVRERIVMEKGELEGKPIFITHAGTVYTKNTYFSLIKYYQRTRSLPKFVTHQFRKLFKTEAGIPERGVDQRVVRFWMGHITHVDDVGGIYDKQPELYEEVVEAEYAKLEPYLNLYSGGLVERGEENVALKKRVVDLERRLKVLDDPVLLEKLKRLAEE